MRQGGQNVTLRSSLESGTLVEIGNPFALDREVLLPPGCRLQGFTTTGLVAGSFLKIRAWYLFEPV